MRPSPALLRRRKSGASDEPMPAGQAVPFAAPDSLAVTVQLPNRGAVRGLGIRQARRFVFASARRRSAVAPPAVPHRCCAACSTATLHQCRRGVTLIVGGGFHGKTTLLKAVEAGVYNKVPACLQLQLQL